jgi:hypothetical protein
MCVKGHGLEPSHGQGLRRSEELDCWRTEHERKLTIREHLAASDHGAEAPHYLSDDGEDKEGGGGGQERVLLNKLETDDVLPRAQRSVAAPLSAVSSPLRLGSPASVR